MSEILLQVKFEVIRNKSIAARTEHGLVFIKKAESETLSQLPDLLFPSFSSGFNFAAQRNPEAGVDMLRVGRCPESSRLVLHLYTPFPFVVHSPCLGAILDQSVAISTETDAVTQHHKPLVVADFSLYSELW